MPTLDSGSFLVSGSVSGTLSTGDKTATTLLVPFDVQINGAQFLLGTAGSTASTVNIKVIPPTTPAVYPLSSYTTQDGTTVTNYPTKDMSKPTTAKTGDVAYPAYNTAADFTPNTNATVKAYATDITIAANKVAAQAGAADNLGVTDARTAGKIFAGSQILITVVTAGTSAAALTYAIELDKV